LAKPHEVSLGYLIIKPFCMACLALLPLGHVGHEDNPCISIAWIGIRMTKAKGQRKIHGQQILWMIPHLVL